MEAHSLSAPEEIQSFFEDARRVSQFRSQREYNFFSRRRVVFELLEATEFEQLADLGCGSGGYLEVVERFGCEYHGIDFAENMVASARERAVELGVAHRASFETGQVEATPYSDHQFDVVIGIGLIEYFTDPGALISEIRRILRPEGHLILQSYLPNAYVDSIRRALGPVERWTGRAAPAIQRRRYSKRELDSLLRAAGFELVDHGFSNFHLLPEPFATRFPQAHARLSEAIRRRRPRGCERWAVNYVGKYRFHASRADRADAPALRGPSQRTSERRRETR